MDEQTRMELRTSRSDFNRIIVKPFNAWGWKYSEEQAGMLYPMVAHFDESALQNAANELIRESKFKPKPAEIIAICRKFNPEIKGDGLDFSKTLEARENESKRKAAEYSKSFQHTQLFEQARQEGWDKEFGLFVSRTADTMQQIIDAVPNRTTGKITYGFSNDAVPTNYVYVYRELLKKSHRPLRNSGQIHVMLALPNLAIPYWQNKAATAKPSATNPGLERYFDEALQRISSIQPTV